MEGNLDLRCIVLSVGLCLLSEAVHHAVSRRAKAAFRSPPGTYTGGSTTRPCGGRRLSLGCWGIRGTAEDSTTGWSIRTMMWKVAENRWHSVCSFGTFTDLIRPAIFKSTPTTFYRMCKLAVATKFRVAFTGTCRFHRYCTGTKNTRT
jgi:hypothetical protein